MQNQQPAPPAYPLDTNARGKVCGTFHTFREFFEQPAAFHEKWKAAALFVSFSKQKPPAEPVETKSLDKRNPPLL